MFAQTWLIVKRTCLGYPARSAMFEEWLELETKIRTENCFCRDPDHFLTGACFTAGGQSTAVRTQRYQWTHRAFEQLSREGGPDQLLGYVVSTLSERNADDGSALSSL